MELGKILGGSCCIGVIAIIVLIVISFSSVGVAEYGLDYSGISKTIDKQIYNPGLHWLGLGHSFITFPSTVINMQFSDFEARADAPSIKSRTLDGLEIDIEVSF